MFAKVLISSVCSILLCVACLLGTTWAWFAVSLENTENEIRIAEVIPMVEVKCGDNLILPSENGGYALETGTYSVGVRVKNDATSVDDLQRPRRNVYVVMTVTCDEKPKSYCFAFTGNLTEDEQRSNIQIVGDTATVSFSVSWLAPASAELVVGEEIVIGQTTEQLTEFSRTTEATTVATEATEMTGDSVVF